MNRIFQWILNIVFRINRRLTTLTDTPRKNILVLSFHNLGDTIHTIPSIRALYKNFGDNLVLCSYPESKKIYNLEFERLRIISIERDEIIRKRFTGIQARKKLKSVYPKYIIDLTGSILSVSIIMGRRTEKIFGIAQPGYQALYDNCCFKRTIPHLSDVYIDAIKCVLPIDSIPLKENKTAIDKSGRILIHPFAGWEAKEWNTEKFLELACRISEEYECALIYDKKQRGRIKLPAGKLEFSLTEPANIDELIEEIKKCSVFIGCDSGPLYIAGLLGKATFSVYGPTNPDYSLPSGKYHSYIRKKIICSPGENQQYCFTNAGRKGCPSFECMIRLEISEVLHSINKFLESLEIKKNRYENITAG